MLVINRTASSVNLGHRIRRTVGNRLGIREVMSSGDSRRGAVAV